MKFIPICLLLFLLCGCSSQKKFVAPPFGGGVKPVIHSSLSLAPDTSLVASSSQTDLYVRPNIVNEKPHLKGQAVKRVIKKAYNLLRPDKEKDGGGGAIASFVLGVIGLFLFGFILGIIALVKGANAMARGTPNQGFAIAGFILGIVDIVAGIIILAVLFL